MRVIQPDGYSRIVCPVCGSDEINCIDENYDGDRLETMECETCDSEWVEHFVLHHVLVIKDTKQEGQ